MTIEAESNSNVDSPLSDRRSEERAATVFRPVLIETEEFAGFCLVRNLSANGMRGCAYTSFAESMAITVQFSAEKTVSGRITWSKDEHIGVEFDEPIDVGRVLSDLAKKYVQGKVNRAPRLQIACSAELTIGDRTLAIQLQNISQRGIKAAASFIRPGDEVQVRLEGLHRKAVVRWTQGGAAGLNFLRPLSFEELAHWVIRQQSGNPLTDFSQIPSTEPMADAYLRLLGAVRFSARGSTS